MEYKNFKLKFNGITIFMYKENIKIGKCKIYKMGNKISLWDFEILKPFRRNGHAKQFMTYLIYNYKVNSLRVNPVEDIDVNSLINFYKSFGFEIQFIHIFGIEMIKRY